MVFMCVPAVTVNDESSAASYVQRLSALSSYFDAITERYIQATREGRFSTRIGITRALEQLQGHLELSLEDDTLANPATGPQIDRTGFIAQTSKIVSDSVRPAIQRLIECLRDEMLPVARDNEHVGLLYAADGATSYAKAVRRHTTTDLTPEYVNFNMGE